MDEQYYGAYYKTLQAAESAIIAALAKNKQICENKNIRFPIEHYKSRIKSAASAKAKLKRLGLPLSAESAQKNLYDLVGVRIVCRFFNDIYEIVRILKETQGLEIIQLKDYVESPKANGYRSVHVIAKISLNHPDKTQYVELQIRTIAMDFWASLEHELKYKKHIPDTEIMLAELKRCADEIISVDLSMQTIYDWLHKPHASDG